jgi:RecB family exonuclease
LRVRGLSSDLSFKDIISKLDQYQTEHYQKLYNLELPKVAADLNEIIHATADLCKTFETEQNFGFWSIELQKLLSSAFSLENIEKLKIRDRLLYESLDLSFAYLKKLGNFELSFNEFLVPAEVAFDLLLSALSEGQFYPEIDESRIKIIGQLESLLDDSEYLVLCDMNEGSVPEVLISDWLLPNSTRTLLNLQNNDQRFAREIYFQLAHLNSKQKVIYLCPKVAANGKDVLEASRIFYNVKDSELAERVQHLLISEKYGEQVEMTDSRLPLFRVPEVKQEGLASIAVTNFRAYIDCPYRFYLKHVLKLNTQEYDAIELTAMHYGIIIHTVLQKFANSIEANLVDRDQINHCLQDHLSDYYSSNFGNNSMPALAIQRDLISQRLQSFSNWQSARRAAGWKIKESEFDLSAYNIVLDHNAGLTTLRGRIDRIDYNEITKELCIIDYKTSDYAKTPERVHKKSGRWVDLQLPLYHYALRCLEHVEAIQLAYVSLSAQKYDTQFAVAKWSEPDLEEALTKAREVAEAVYLGKFWPPNMEYESQNVGVNDPFSFMLREATL